MRERESVCECYGRLLGRRPWLWLSSYCGLGCPPRPRAAYGMGKEFSGNPSGPGLAPHPHRVTGLGGYCTESVLLAWLRPTDPSSAASLGARGRKRP